ncbi:ATP-binding protein [Cryptosporangium japonicum]|uniref:Histidine kinase/HSP90-like ATPase domain-containing protein n=1 Tax=Cryptosporangium japonicum TaxID=80872 RepID=A0ABP3EXR7_9ACTN
MPATLRHAHSAQIHPAPTTLTRSARDPDAADNAVEVICPATAEQLPVLRAIATSIALRADADLDLVADLRLAVDEACTALVRAAGSGEPLHCRFIQHPDAVEVVVAAWAPQPSPAEDELGILLLSSLTDHIATETQAVDDGFELRTSLLMKVHPEGTRS